MPKVKLIGILILSLSLTLCLPALAKPPGGTPPGQAKKNNSNGGVNIGINVGQSSSVSKGKTNGPPPWAPAHGYRAKHQYRYWPGHQVYFDSGRGLYFWFSSGDWQAGAKLPGRITLGNDFVTLDMDTAKPYQWHNEVEVRYPAKK